MNRPILFLTVLFLASCVTKNDYKTIILKTTGYIETVPNEASILLEINCVDKNILQAKKCLIEKTNNLNNDLENYGIQKQDILTTGVNLSKNYVWINNSNIFNGFNASTSMNIKIRDLKLLDDLYTKLLTNDKLTIGSLTYQHNKIDSLSEIAYLKALDNANKIADKILSQLPEKNKMITRISNIMIKPSENNVDLRFNEVAAESDLNKDKLPLNIGNMIVEQQLYVEFKIY